jgi:hypothetical protein
MIGPGVYPPLSLAKEPFIQHHSATRNQKAAAISSYQPAAGAINEEHVQQQKVNGNSATRHAHQQLFVSQEYVAQHVQATVQ